MHSPEIPLEDTELPVQEFGTLVEESTPGSYLEKALLVRHGDIDAELEEISDLHFLLNVQRHPGAHSSPAAITESAQLIMKREFGFDLFDSDTIFPDGENDPNHFEIDLKFGPKVA